MAHRLRPEPIEFVDRAPIRIRAEATIGASPSQVWPAISDAAAWEAWFTGMKVAHYTSPEPHAVGSTRHVQVQTLRVDETIIAFDPDERFGFRVDGASLPALAAMVEVVTLEPVGSATRVVYRQALELKPWARVLAPVVRRQLASALCTSLVGLDRFVTSRPEPT